MKHSQRDLEEMEISPGIRAEKRFRLLSLIFLLFFLTGFYLRRELGIRYTIPIIEAYTLPRLTLYPILAYLCLVMSKSSKLLLVLLALPIAFLGLIFSLSTFLAVMETPTILEKGYIPSNKLLRTEEICGKQYSVFRTDGGATTAFGVVVRKELPVFPGIVQSKIVYDKYRSYDVQIHEDNCQLKFVEGNSILSRTD